MKILIACLFFIQTTHIWSQSKLDGEFSGNVEAQARHSWNNEAAQDDLFQDWEEEDFYLIYGNLNGKVNFRNSRMEANLFARHSQSDLYRDQSPMPPLLATQIFTFPQKLVARDIFKLNHEEEGDTYRSEYVLNKLYYEWDYDEHRFTGGRMYINYGQGEIFNPINPFNQPTGLTAISQVAQGNDGLNFTFYANEKHTIDYYFLGDKTLDGYEDQIEKTLWIHGEYQVSNVFQLDYVLGEDQNRHKIGGQVRYNFSEAMVFLQTLFQTDYTDDKESHALWDVLLAYDQQINNKFHLRVESGYQKKNRHATLESITDRFLPSEYFIAMAGQYEIHPLVKLGGTFINDIKTGFTYFIMRNTFDLGHDTEAEIFGYLPVAKGSDFENPAQKLVTTDIGMALRTFF
jgi:hypothetical protein